MDKKFIAYISIALVVVFLLCSCAPAANSQAPRTVVQTMVVSEALNQPAATFKSAQGSGATSDQAVVNQSNTSNRIVIKNASLEIVVEDPATAMETITKMAEDMGGFIVTSNLYKISSDTGAQIPEATITVRVPAEQLTSAMDQIKSLVKDKQKDIRVENITGQDVTSEYTDIESRLTNLKDAVAQLREIMASSQKTEDTLAVYNQIVQLNEQIDVLEGQKKYYDESAKMSAISVKLIAQESIKPVTIGGWEPVGVARDATQALINALKFFVNAGIWIIIFVLPVLIIIAIPFLVLGLIIRAIILRRRKKSHPPEESTSTPSEEEKPAA